MIRKYRVLVVDCQQLTAKERISHNSNEISISHQNQQFKQ